MEEVVLNDKTSEPSDELIASILGDTDLLWKQTFSYLFDNHKDISVEWKYTCGKVWSCQVRKKKDFVLDWNLKKKLLWYRVSFWQ